MINTTTLYDISTNINTGIEYEIALFYQLLKPNEQSIVGGEIDKRRDSAKIKSIILGTDPNIILKEIWKRDYELYDVSFETQNDDVGPADIVLYLRKNENTKRIGISVKYSNTCTLNVTGRRFITDDQISLIKEKYVSYYVPKYIAYMHKAFGEVTNWHRKTSPITDEVIDEIRNAVIENWKCVNNKPSLLGNLFHTESPIEFWVATFEKNGYDLRTEPQTIDIRRANDVKVEKYQTSYVAFMLVGIRVGKMQVKFNNGFIESNYNHKGERKKNKADFLIDGLEFNYGQPFGSWNFSVEK
jgi:hypothetical protein